jgi:hypothetical protein
MLPEDTKLIINIVLTAVTVLGTLGAGFVFLWIRENRRQRDFQMRMAEEQMHYQRKQAEREEILRREEMEREEQRREEERKQQEQASFQQTAGVGTGGYIVVDLPNDKKPLFHDLLKGFEEYASLKGYTVFFSIDSTFNDRIAFKFTLGDEGVGVSPEKVKRDFREYIKKIETDQSLDDLPVVTSIEEHNLLVTIMKNRINFLQHSYNLQKNAVEFYERLVRNFSSFPMLPAPSVLVQTGGVMDSRSYKSTNSSRLIQGDSNDYTDNSIDASVHIADSFNERKEQIENLAKLIEALRTDNQLEPTDKERVIVNLEKVKDELADEEKPDESRIKKWLGKARSSLELLKVGKAGADLAMEVYKSFGIDDLFAK